LKTSVEVELQKGNGILFRSEAVTPLLRNTIDRSLPNEIRKNNLVVVTVDSQIPAGMGLKSSSAVSSATVLACTALVGDDLDDEIILNSAIRASLEAGVTITGAYDDSTACYFGGIVVTNNYRRELICREEAPADLYVVVFLLTSLQRGALSASISGNGPSIAAVTYKEHIDDIIQMYDKYKGVTLVSKANNNKASFEVLVG
jgi:shikimate kinase